MALTEFQSRILIHPENFDGTGITTDATLARARMQDPDNITKIVTLLMGVWGYADTPLLQITEGASGGSKEISGTEYEYPIMGKQKRTTTVLSTQYGAGDTPGANQTPFFIVFREKWFPPQQTISCGQFGVSARVMSEPVPFVGGGWRYELQLVNPAVTSCSLNALQPGTVWGMTGGATVSSALSVGNWSPVQTPGRRKGQLSFLRQSYRLAGNIASKMVEFKVAGQGMPSSSMWLDFEEFQHMMAWKQAKEEHLWLSEYNRDANGVVTMIDPTTQLPIPYGAGLKQQIPNSTTYSFLTEKLIRTIVGDTMNGTPDTNKMDIMLFCGNGFREEFDNAMKGSAIFTQVAQGSTGQFVKSVGGNLQLGGYFTSYQSIDGHVITLKTLPFLNHGGYADASGVHPVTGRPRSSYEAYFVDASTYDGQPNLQMVHQKGRMELRGLMQGMTVLPESEFFNFKGNDALRLATERDETSVHFMCSAGIQMLRDTNSFKLELA